MRTRRGFRPQRGSIAGSSVRVVCAGRPAPPRSAQLARRAVSRFTLATAASARGALIAARGSALPARLGGSAGARGPPNWQQLNPDTSKMDPLDPQNASGGGEGGDPSLFWNDLGAFGDGGLDNLWWVATTWHAFSGARGTGGVAGRGAQQCAVPEGANKPSRVGALAPPQRTMRTQQAVLLVVLWGDGMPHGFHMHTDGQSHVPGGTSPN